MDHQQAMQQSLDDEHEFLGKFLSFFPEDLSPSVMLGHAVDILLCDCPRVRHAIWLKTHDTMNIELVNSPSLSRSERLMAEAAVSIWTAGDEYKINLWEFLNKADFRGNQNFIRALNILFHWYASKDQPDAQSAEGILERMFESERGYRAYARYQS